MNSNKYNSVILIFILFQLIIILFLPTGCGGQDTPSNVVINETRTLEPDDNSKKTENPGGTPTSGEKGQTSSPAAKTPNLDAVNRKINPQLDSAFSHYLDKEYDKAIEEFSSFIRENPHHKEIAVLYRYRGSCFYEKGDYDNAIKDFSSAIEMKKDSPYLLAITERGYAYMKKGETLKARNDWQRVIEADEEERFSPLAREGMNLINNP